MERYIYFTLGLLAGVAIAFYDVDMPIEQRCQTYTVQTKAVTAYVLKPPYVAPEIIREKCPAPQVIKADENVSEPGITNIEDKPRHRRHRRHRRHW